jgi:hypothetical protein
MLPPPPAWIPRQLLTAFLTAFILELLFYCYHYPTCISHLIYLQLLCKLLVKISHSCSTIVPNKEFKIIVIYIFEPPTFLPISLAFPSHFPRISLLFTIASSQPNSPSDSKPKAIPESPPTLPSLPNAPPSLYNPILSLPNAPLSLPNAPLSLPNAPLSVYTFPLPPLNQQYDTLEQGIAAINAFSALNSYAVLILRSKRTKKGVIKTVRLYYNRGRAYRDRSAGKER